MLPFVLACPHCKSTLPGSLSCSACGQVYSHRDGIYRFLLPERQQALESFMSQYRQIRTSDGYRSRPAQYYRSLPYTHPLDPQAQNWRVRAETFEHLLPLVLSVACQNSTNCLLAAGAPGRSTPRARGAAAGRASPSLSVLDLGAGNSWLSNRLAALGHRCVAVDCSDDAVDGLGTFIHYSLPFTSVQADFDQLPFAPQQFDVVIFNASLHYSPNIQATLGHAHTMLVPGGALMVMDSPTFWSATSGRLMLTEQTGRMRAQSGLAQLVMPGVGYLWADALIMAGRHLGLEFRFTPSRGSVGWALRRLLAGVKRRREPAHFGLWHGRP